MDYQTRALQVDEMLGRLGQSPGKKVIEDFAQALARALATSVAIDEIAKTTATLRFSLDGVRLRNFNNVFMLLGISPVPNTEELHEWKNRMNAPDRFAIVFSSASSWNQLVMSVFPPTQGFLGVSTRQMTDLLCSSDAQGDLKRLARSSISSYRLNPFGITSVTPTNMFFGRESELEALMYSDNTSFAIAGPGRIGKTSLLQQYMRRLRTADPRRFSRVVFVDFYYLDQWRDHDIARQIAIATHDGSRARNLQDYGQFRNFLIYETKQRLGPLEMLFDEVDLICESKAFAQVAQMAKERLCRLILCGKGGLFEACNHPAHPLYGRVRLMQLTPLSFEDTQELFLGAFLDLGYSLDDDAQLAAEVFRYTNGLPHLVQYLGNELMSVAVRQGVRTIDVNLFRRVCDRYETAQFFIAPIQGLRDEATELIALALLKEQSDTFNEVDVAELARRHGMNYDQRNIAAICRDLYIHNILTWKHDHYSLTTKALARYARQLGACPSMS